jgi:hypothetical protein
MKKIFLLAVLFAVCLLSFAQEKGNAKLFGYKQAVLPGTPGGVINEGGQEVSTETASKKNYRIYIQSASRIYPVEMWIEGQPYSVSMDIITTTPVVHGTEAMNNRKELVPKTGQKVLMLTPRTYTETKNVGDMRSIAMENELVVVYKMNGKFYYNSLEKLSHLETAAMQ